jgi:hypothetical protein
MMVRENSWPDSIRCKTATAMLFVLAMPVGTMQGQFAPPMVSVGTAGPASRSVSAAEALHETFLTKARLEVAVSARQAQYPIDSILRVAERRADDWLGHLKRANVRGVQQDALGRLAVRAGDEAYAASQFASRLAMPGLSFDDRAFTHVVAVQAFADWHFPARLPKAEAYLASLIAMGDSAATWQFQARSALMNAYYMLGQSADVARHGVLAVNLARLIPFKARQWTVLPPYDGNPVYTMTVEALAGLPNGRASIDQLNATLRAATIPPAALVAIDSGFVTLGKVYVRGLERVIGESALVGTVGAPLAASVWLNRERQDAMTVPVNDGKIRIIEFSIYGCPGCIAKLVDLQRVKAACPNTEVVFLTQTTGYWANRFVPPSEESARLSDRFIGKMRIDFPIGIEHVPLVENEDGGMIPRDLGLNMANYPGNYPLTIAIDGRGVIRRIFLSSGREGERQMIQTVQFLEREMAKAPHRATHDVPDSNRSSGTQGITP